MSESGPTAPQIFFAILLIGGLGWYGYTWFQSSSFGVSGAARTVYDALGVDPLPNALAGKPKVAAAIEDLAVEPCGEAQIFAFVNALAEEGEARAAANALLGYANNCEGAEGELYAAANQLFGLGDYEATLVAATRLIEARPAVGQYYFARGQALAALERHEDAAADYLSAVALADGRAQAVGPLYKALGDAYETLREPCAAAAALASHAARGGALNAGLRRSFTRRREACGEAWATGEIIIDKRGGALTANAVVNGVRGRFRIAQSAPVVALTADFARRAGVKAASETPTQARLSTGVAEGRRARVAALALGKARAGQVSVVALTGPKTGSLDGVIGLSFLARFEITEGDGAIRLRAAP